MTKVACMKCQAEFFDDGNTWCPRCDAAQDFGRWAANGAGQRIAELREWYQRNLAAGRGQFDESVEPNPTRLD